MNRSVFGILLCWMICLTGCQSESQREAAQQKREEELEENLEELFGAFAEALEEASESESGDYDFGELSPVQTVIREAEGLNDEAIRSFRTSGQADYGKMAKASDMILELFETYDEGELQPYSVDIYVILYNGACAYSMQEDVEKSLSTFKLAVQYGWDDHAHTMVDSDLENLRATEGFKEFVVQMDELAAERAAANIPDEVSFPFEFSLTDINDKPLSLADFKDKVVIVDFWGTWCPPCRAEIPSFIRLQEEFGEQGFQMIGLNYEGGNPSSDLEKVRNYVTSEGINYPCALGDDATQDQVPGFDAYPTTLFIDKTGKVRHRLVGLHQYNDLAAIVKKLLAE